MGLLSQNVINVEHDDDVAVTPCEPVDLSQTCGERNKTSVRQAWQAKVNFYPSVGRNTKTEVVSMSVLRTAGQHIRPHLNEGSLEFVSARICMTLVWSKRWA